MGRSYLFGVAMVVMSAIAFGSGGLFARPAYAAGIDWLTLMAWRFAIAGALGWALVLLSPSARRDLRRIRRPSVLVAIGLGIVYIGNTATYYAGITTTPLSLAALIVSIYPPVVAVLALRLGRPLEGRRAWTALAIAVAGVALAVGGIDTSVMPPIPGLLAVIAAPLIYAVWIILAARSAGERREHTGADSEGASNALVAGAIMLSATGAAYWIACLGIGHPVLPADIPPDAWPGILGVAVVAGFLATQGFYAGAKHVGAAQASLISTVEPLWTILAAGILLGERLTPVQWVGGALILAGVLLSQTRGRAARGRSGGPADDEPVLPQPAVRLGED